LSPVIIGKNSQKVINTNALIGRSSPHILRAAIDQVIDQKNISSLHFEGQFRQYLQAADGASIQEILNLYTGEKSRIEHPFLKVIDSLETLEEYAHSLYDHRYIGLIGIVRQYGKGLPAILKAIKKIQVAEDKKEQADLILSSIEHASKTSYDEVRLLDD